jgi:hypothetical protein
MPNTGEVGERHHETEEKNAYVIILNTQKVLMSQKWDDRKTDEVVLEYHPHAF